MRLTTLRSGGRAPPVRSTLQTPSSLITRLAFRDMLGPNVPFAPMDAEPAAALPAAGRRRGVAPPARGTAGGARASGRGLPALADLERPRPRPGVAARARGGGPRRRDREAARAAVPPRLPGGRRQGEAAPDRRLRGD